jgi:hypothetical protein
MPGSEEFQPKYFHILFFLYLMRVLMYLFIFYDLHLFSPIGLNVTHIPIRIIQPFISYQESEVLDNALNIGLYMLVVYDLLGSIVNYLVILSLLCYTMLL